MPRPTRVEYAGAFYHVMNRGRSRNDIFLNETHYKIFLKVLEETCNRFNCIIHSYCLMPNHYHLLIETVEANLSRVMRHINGVYVQRFNKVQRIDGPLFRGRYKGILVDADDYLIVLSKYIHRNPIQTKKKENRLVNNLSDYQWSSYQSYLGITSTPKWLNKELTLSKFRDDINFIKSYQLFVETEEENSELSEFFAKRNQEMILGSREFKERILIDELEDQRVQQDRVRREINDQVTVDQIIGIIAKVFDVTVESIIKKEVGQRKENIPRGISMYLIQELKNYKLKEIADIFQLNHYGSVSKFLFNIRTKVAQGCFIEELRMIKINLRIEE